MSTGTWALLAAIAAVAAMTIAGVLYTRSRKLTVEDYVSARNSTSGITAMATAVASVMGAWILFSPAEAATWAGLVAVIGYGIGQAAPVLAFVVLGPRMLRIMPQGHSLSEFVWYRYGKAMYAAVLAIMLLYMFTFLAAEMGAIARAVELVTGAPLMATLLLVGGSTLIYTAYGGLRASIFTDNIQFLLIIPLLIVVLAAAIGELGGWSGAFDPVRDKAPALLSMTHQPGIEFGITLIIAILAANLFHQGFWQRVYAAKGAPEVRQGFLLAALLVIPMVIAGGLFGLWAVGRDVANPGSIALFSLALEILPGWVLVVLVVLALMLVMSSADTLLNAMASVITSDLPHLRTGLSGSQLLSSGRLLTGVFIVPAIIVGFFFDSVLYLFLIADLVCAGAAVPVFLGMYLKRFDGRAALTASLLGIGVGALLFPTKSLAGWWTWEWLTAKWHILASGNTLGSFLAAVVVSSAVAAVLTVAMRQRTDAFDFDALANQVHRLEASA